MIQNLSYDYNLRGYSFEYIARIMLRRQNKNNFIFQTSRFDSINEILDKYRLNISAKLINIITLLKKEWKRCDLIEFVLKDKTKREISQIIIYDVKTKFHTVDRKYFEFCKSNFKFFKKCNEMNISTKIISIILFENWRFSFNVSNFEKAPIKVYSRFKN